ncbi:MULTISPECIES: cytochrome P450 [unclassified Actinopolyspora]|uniref:cytochrome P450 family protein n=1 Tax=unclassified Actinopolyspora TaxID=2639451 RepID=UPI0013F6677D|nr:MULTISPECIES: cytochrome P450 [unclassified Actinopolyspora]NHD19535.1 cytochrome P450 [Actinopolyspora sp. BKK2]NHE78691.1 cytochrome P450 [Actinopolyspora sp. BKK1]
MVASPAADDGPAVSESGACAPEVRHPITLGSPEFVAAPQAHCTWLRTHAPVYRGRIDSALVDQDVWIVSRYADCKSLLTDDRFPRSPAGGPAIAEGMPDHLRLLSESMIYKDSHEHRRLRRLVAKPFTPRAIERLGRRVSELAHGLLDELESREVVDLRSEFALPVPMTVISEMVGVDEADRERFHRGIQGLLSGMGESEREVDHDEGAALAEFVRELIERRRRAPGDDLLTGLIQAEEQGERLADDELAAMVFTLVTAGYETTYNLITNAVVALLDHPDQLALLRADPALMGSAVEEAVRYLGPVQSSEALTAAEDVTWHGRTIPAGSLVLPLLAAANHDPAVFAAPETFDITRGPNHHLGFGHGEHFCLGANLARMEARVALDALLRRNPGLALAVDREQLALEAVPMLVRYRSLPVHLG